MKKAMLFLSGAVIGAVNLLLGAGAGSLAVMLLKKQGFPQKQAQANAVAVIMPVSFISLIIYFLNGRVNLYDNILLIPTGVLGAAAGTLLMRKITPRFSRRLLGAFMIFAAVRMIIR